ncbi:TPM domain-containing protein [Desulfonatronum thioautotrophicum]|uniref:TPM domain-containing protein n=1 Tax=Desulfonatronum thioautotrophicum TaxID=617001 RepID=UPI00069C804B|nr:TPM domain-containing protein [Desulfonatronum thioautotrophicum]
MPFGVRRDSPPWEGLVRALGIVFVFMGVIWLFWKHNQRTIEMLDTHQVVVDRGGQLTEEQKRSVRDLSRALKSSFGLDLQLVVTTDTLPRPMVDTKTIHIGIYPEGEAVLVVLPPIVERALGQGFTRYLQDSHFEPYWADGNWRRGLGEALSLIWEALNSPEGEGGVSWNRERQSPENYDYRGVVRDEGSVQ